MNHKKFDVVVVGCGPAGLTAALYLLRANKSVALFDGSGIGGQMGKAPKIENYPGFDGTGAELAEMMYVSVCKYNHEYYMEDVLTVEYNDTTDCYHITSEYGTEVDSTNIIIATGGRPIPLRAMGADRDNIHYCVTCDGPLYKNKRTVVIGDANSALQYAYELSTICETVDLCAWGDELFGEPVWVQKVLSRPNITVHRRFDTVAIDDDGVHSADGRLLPTDGVFVAIGYLPVLPEQLINITCPTNYRGYVYTYDDGSTQEGAYFIGDVTDKNYRQIISAANDGMEVALNIIKGER